MPSFERLKIPNAITFTNKTKTVEWIQEQPFSDLRKASTICASEQHAVLYADTLLCVSTGANSFYAYAQTICRYCTSMSFKTFTPIREVHKNIATITVVGLKNSAQNSVLHMLVFHKPSKRLLHKIPCSLFYTSHSLNLWLVTYTWGGKSPGS